MATIQLNEVEASVLRTVLSALVIRERTGELGILHGLDRFVSTRQILRKQDRAVLDSLVDKLGAGHAVRRDRS